ncbi:GntR family transcriptional regulator [Pseudonocardia phyllosphaerae]|uniref:GntR family transcriptional regulator n=1 Tax=Pseudonocardia phyllosphaerae TaxID=3390502 RepID=UPI00397D9B56
MPVPSPIAPARSGDARRVRDLLRVAIAGRSQLRGLLPGTDELMREYAASRSAVRTALALLTDEGLLRPGPGAFRVVARPGYTGTAPAPVLPRVPGTVPASGAPAGSGSARHIPAVPDPDPAQPPRWVDRAGIAAPEALATWLGVPSGSPCLRLECVSVTVDGGRLFATHYLSGTDAAALLAVPETGIFDRLLADAGLAPAEVRTRCGPVPADPDVALQLGVATRTPVLGTERTLLGSDGRVLAAVIARSRPGSLAHRAATADGAGSGDTQPDSNARTDSSVSAWAGVLSGR